MTAPTGLGTRSSRPPDTTRPSCYTAWPTFTEVTPDVGYAILEVQTVDELDAAIALTPCLYRPLLIDVAIDPTLDPCTE